MASLGQERGQIGTEIPCVIYGAKSTPDPRASIPTQIADCREAIDRTGGREVVGEQADENKTAYKGNRGPGLAEAKRLAIEAAERHGGAEIWVQHSDRLARGDGLTADHLAEVFFAMRRGKVRLRSVQDDGNLEDAIRAVLIGERNTEDSRRKSEAVKSGKRRAFERGEVGGGPVPDGYQLLRNVDDRGNVRRSARLDLERDHVIRLIFDLDEQGWGAPSIARELNRRGLRTRGRGTSPGIPWTRRRVQDTLTNPVYAGAVVLHRGSPEQEINWDGQHPALIDAERFARLARARAVRDRARDSNRNPRGRTHVNHALARLARCGSCDAPMRPVTGTYRRKSDGQRRRTYLCANVKEATGLCDSPSVDATLIDAAVISELGRYLGDMEAWTDQILAGHEAERTKLAREVDRAQVELDQRDTLIAKLEADYERCVAAGDDADAATALSIVTRRRDERDGYERRLQAARDAADAVPDDVPTDAMLDFYNAFSAAIKGRLNEAGDSIARVNDALKDLFECFYLDTRPDGVAVRPILLNRDFATVQSMYSIVTEDDEFAPPLRAIAAPSPELTNAQA